MSRKEVERLAAEIREQNELYDAGDTDRAFWLGQQRRLEQMKVEDPTLTNVAIGKLIGKSTTWMSSVLRWDSRARDLPDWASGSNKRDDVVDKALRDPARRRKAIEDLPDEVRSEVIRDSLDVESRKAKPVDKKQRLGESDAELAEKTTDDAYWALRRRSEFYADTPLSDHEKMLVPVIHKLAEKMEQGVLMDDELAALFEEANHD